MYSFEYRLKCPHCRNPQTELTTIENPPIALKCESCGRIASMDKWIITEKIAGAETKNRRYDPRMEAKDTIEPIIARAARARAGN